MTENISPRTPSPSPIIVALDGIDRDRALGLAHELRDIVWGVKVNDLLLAYGTAIVRDLSQVTRVFADPKLHDIPNTVANGVKRLSDAGASLITVHASGGPAMLEAAAREAGNATILAVTVLTSISETECCRIFSRSAPDTVVHLAGMAAQSQVGGIVCSPQELPRLAADPVCAKLLKVVPGVRPAAARHASSKDDQVRIGTPQDALAKGAGLLVIGRPITEDPHPREAALRIVSELQAR